MTKLTIGTAQFGLDYGVTNKEGIVGVSEVENILKLAQQNNVRGIDTASSYGKSEKVLGECGLKNFEVTTKISLDRSKKIGADQLFETFYKSLKLLDLDSVNVLLAHNTDEYLLHHGTYQFFFEELKRKGLIKKMGVSLYTVEQLDNILQVGDIEVVQYPLHFFDRRFLKEETQEKMKKLEIEQQVRSVFMQGLLLQESQVLDSFFSFFLPAYKKYELFLKEKGMSKLEGALKFIFDQENISSVAIGICSRQQFKEILSAWDKVSHMAEFNYPANDCIDERLFNPLLWPMLKR